MLGSKIIMAGLSTPLIVGLLGKEMFLVSQEGGEDEMKTTMKKKRKNKLRQNSSIAENDTSKIEAAGILGKA
jgi:hypothetical protein